MVLPPQALYVEPVIMGEVSDSHTSPGSCQKLTASCVLSQAE